MNKQTSKLFQGMYDIVHFEFSLLLLRVCWLAHEALPGVNKMSR